LASLPTSAISPDASNPIISVTPGGGGY